METYVFWKHQKKQSKMEQEMLRVDGHPQTHQLSTALRYAVSKRSGFVK